MRWFALCLILLYAPARATTYALEDVQYNAAAKFAGLGIPLPPISLTLDPAAVAGGHFDFHATGPGQVTGDAPDLVAFRVGSTTIRGDGAGGLYAHLNLSLTFAPDGTVTSALFDWLSPMAEFYLTGSANDFGGFFSPSDNSLCGYNTAPQYACRVTGALLDPPDPPAAPIPEPATTLIAITGLSAALLLRRRKRAQPDDAV